MSLPELETKLNNCGLYDNTSSTTLSDESGEKPKILKICFNGGDVIEVNKKKLLKKSLYFQAITNSSFNDHKKDIVEVNFDASFEIFHQAINYLETGDIQRRKNDHVLEIFELATYLQIECIIKKFKDTFVYNLNTRTLVKQLSLIKDNPLFKDFEDVALKFKNSGKPSISGLYIIERCNKEDPCTNFIHIKSLVNEESNCNLVSQIYKDKCDYRQQIDQNAAIVGRFCNSLIIDDLEYIYQYNLITGDMVKICEIKGYFYVCSDDENLYFLEVSYYKYQRRYHKLKMSVLSSNNSHLKVSETKVFNLLYFAGTQCVFCFSGKIYIFYLKKVSRDEKHAHLLILCTKTFTVLSESKLTDSVSLKFSDAEILKTIYLDKKNQRVFIHCGELLPIMEFDIRSNKYSIVTNFFKHPVNRPNIWSTLLQFCTDPNHDIVYELRSGLRFFDLCSTEYYHKIRAFEYSNGNFVDTGFSCETSDVDWLTISYV